jgi:hypothetical protein
MRRRGLMTMGIALALGSAAAAQTGGGEAVEGVRGISGSVVFRTTGVGIRAKGTQSVHSPIVVRVSEMVDEGRGVTRYRVDYIGAVAGEYDLRECLERLDGTPLGLDPLVVRVVSQLEGTHGTDLFSTSEAPTLRPTAYRAGLVALGVAWVAVPCVYLVVRARRRRKPVEVVEASAPAPTLADQLRPLVEAAMSGGLGVAERGRLELMLYMYWRERLGLEGPQSRVISRLREENEAGRLLRAVEGWLHARRDAGGGGRAEGDVAALLEPYRRAPAIVVQEAAA